VYRGVVDFLEKLNRLRALIIVLALFLSVKGFLFYRVISSLCRAPRPTCRRPRPNATAERSAATLPQEDSDSATDDSNEEDDADDEQEEAGTKERADDEADSPTSEERVSPQAQATKLKQGLARTPYPPLCPDSTGGGTCTSRCGGPSFLARPAPRRALS